MRVLRPNEARHAVRVLLRPTLEEILLAVERGVLLDEVSLAQLVRATVHKLAGEVPALADALVDTAIASVIAKAEDASIARIVVHPSQLERVAGVVARVAPRVATRLRVEAQEDVHPGGGILVLSGSAAGSTAMDAQVETRLELTLGQR